MSTWISDVARWCLPVALAGCAALGGSGNARVAVTADAVVIEGPRGFCVDPEATRDRGATAFVLFGNCAAIAGSRLAGQPDTPAILTATVSEPGGVGIVQSLDDLPEFFAGPDGRRLLSRSGDPDTVEVVQHFAEGPVFYLKAQDTSPDAVPGVREDYWRAYLDAGPRIVTLSVLALDSSGLDDAGSLALLRRFVALVEAGNRAEPETDAGAPRSGLFNSGLFRRILPTGG